MKINETQPKSKEKAEISPNENDTNSNDNASSILIDPNSAFSGAKLKNQTNYICYLNTVVNALLSLKNFREMVPFMEDDIQEIMIRILNGNLNDLELLRIKLHQFSLNRQDGSKFPKGIHSDPVEGLTKLIEMINMKTLYQNCLVDFNLHERCNLCQDESVSTIENPWGNPNILHLKLNGRPTVQEEIDEYIKKEKCAKLKTLFCRKCNDHQPMTITKSIGGHSQITWPAMGGGGGFAK